MNTPVYDLYASGMTQRRMARVLHINRKTVVRKFLFLALQARKNHAAHLATRKKSRAVQFDEMETFEHTKLKPVTIALAVDGKTGEILSASVAPMAYKGRLAHVAFQKYGPREDRSGIAISQALEVVKASASENIHLVTDDSPKYPRRIRRILPNAFHHAAPPVPPAVARRRRNQNDPLFALNVTAAKLRNDLSRLSRKTWVTTKKLERLDAHLALYIAWNNGYPIVA